MILAQRFDEQAHAYRHIGMSTIHKREVPQCFKSCTQSN